VTVQTSSSAAITSFQFRKAENVSLSVSEVSGDIDETGHTVTVTVPADTDLTSLVPKIAHTGASIAPDNDDITPHDFSAPFTYTVTAENLTQVPYVVTVNKPDNLAVTPAGGGASRFYAVAKDASGNTYTVGYQTGSGEYDYGNGQKVAGSFASGINAVIVKYNTSGYAVWAKSVSGGNSLSSFMGVVVSGSNVYAVGTIQGKGQFKYGNSAITPTGGTVLTSAVIVKYDGATGDALWVQTAASSGNAYYSFFNGVAVDTTGSIYAAGTIAIAGAVTTPPGTFTYGSKTAQVSVTNSAMIVKYNAAGDAQWVKSVAGTGRLSRFLGVAVSQDKVYAAGYISSETYDYYVKTTWTYDYGDEKNLSISSPSETESISILSTDQGVPFERVNKEDSVAISDSAVLVQYASNDGTTLWVKSVTAEKQPRSLFNGVAVDSSGSVYAVGGQIGIKSYTYGAQTVAGGSRGQNAMIVKYDSSGNAIWGKAVDLSNAEPEGLAGTSRSSFYGVAVDAAGYIYAAGERAGTEGHVYSGVTVTGGFTSTWIHPGFNAVVAVFNNAGTGQRASSVSGGGDVSTFYGIAASSADNFCAAGAQTGNGTFNYGAVDVTGAYAGGENAVFVRYK
jgi:hypothetical protein